MEPSIYNVVLFMFIFSRLCCSQFTIWDTTLPIPLGMFGVSTYKDELTVINGCNGAIHNLLSYSISLTSTYDGWSNNTFSVFNSNQILNIGDGSVEINDKIYVINPSVGGDSTVTDGQTMLIYDLTLKQYVDTSIYASSPPLRAHYPCVVYNYNNNLIYVIGGYYVERKEYTQTYDITNDLWASVSNINVARNYAGCDMDVSAQHIYLFGGETNAKEYGSSDIEEYTVKTDTWTVLSTTLIDPSRQFDCTLLPSDGKIYCFGGRYKDSYMNCVQQFDPNDYTINKLTMKIPRQYGKSITWGNDCLLIVGGNTGSHGITGAYTDTIEYYGKCTFPTPNTTILISTPSPTPAPKKLEGVFITTPYIIIIILTLVCMVLCCIIVGFIIVCYCVFYRKRLRDVKKQQETNSIAMHVHTHGHGLPKLPRIISPTLPPLPKDDISDDDKEPIPNEININHQKNDEITLGDSMYHKSVEGKMALSNYRSNSEALYVHHDQHVTKGKLCDDPSVSLIQPNDTIDESICVNV